MHDTSDVTSELRPYGIKHLKEKNKNKTDSAGSEDTADVILA